MSRHTGKKSGRGGRSVRAPLCAPGCPPAVCPPGCPAKAADPSSAGGATSGRPQVGLPLRPGGGSGGTSADQPFLEQGFGKIGDDHVRACALEAGEGFEHDGAFVHPAVKPGGADEGVFAADLVGAEGHADVVAHRADNVAVRTGGLDDQGVRAFFQVGQGFNEGLAGVGRVHLVGLAGRVRALSAASRKGP